MVTLKKERVINMFRKIMFIFGVLAISLTLVGCDKEPNIEYVVESAKILEKQIQEKEGEILQPALRIVKTPVPFLDTNIKDWAEKLSKLLK